MAATMGMAARGQQGNSLDPCEPGTFNANVCRVAIRHHGYCSGGVWVPMKYSQDYPNYYDSYQAYLSGGGLAVSAPEEGCRRPHGSSYMARGGFGSTGYFLRSGS
jgi:hypothetical protein